MVLIGSLFLGVIFVVSLIFLGAATSPALVGAIVLVTDIWVVCDASSLGVRKLAPGEGTNERRLDFNGGPVAWFVGCLLLWFFMFPLYLLSRPTLKRLFHGVDGAPASLTALGAQPAPVAAFSPATQPPAEYIEQLRKLAALRDDGIITTEDFERKKAALLGLDR